MVVSLEMGKVKRLAICRFTNLLSWLVASVSDPRGSQGRRVRLPGLLRLLLTGMVVGDPTLRDVEQRSKGFGLKDRRGRPVKKISDTCLGDLLAALDPEEFIGPLVRQVRQMLRRKELRPEGLRVGVLVIDGKHLATLMHDAAGWGMRVLDKARQHVCWRVRVLRAVLSSARGKPCIGQLPIHGRAGEISSLPGFLRWLHETYGNSGMFEVIDLDAGFLSREVFSFIDSCAARAYVQPRAQGRTSAGRGPH